jgi:hypothetical protein
MNQEIEIKHLEASDLPIRAWNFTLQKYECALKHKIGDKIEIVNFTYKLKSKAAI